METRYCPSCAAVMEKHVPELDDRPRDVCTTCGYIYYENPKMVVGTIPETDGRILLCRRNIDPCRGKWTLPAGYLENGETLQQGAVRETLEEARASVDRVEPFRLFNIAFVNQVYCMFRARLLSQGFGPTPESSEVRLFEEEQIPWDDIAFQVIVLTLEHFFQGRRSGDFRFRIHDIEAPGKRGCHGKTD